MKWMKVKLFNWVTFLLEWWASTPPSVSSQLKPAVSGFSVCFLPSRKKRWRSPDKFDAIFLILICILSQSLAKRRPYLFLELHSKACSGTLHMLTNCWLFSTKDNDLHFTICCLSWNCRHLFKSSTSCWSRHNLKQYHKMNTFIM